MDVKMDVKWMSSKKAKNKVNTVITTYLINKYTYCKMALYLKISLDKLNISTYILIQTEKT